jgi:signal peptide peptidase SppA
MTHLARIAGRLFGEPLLVSQSYLDVALTAIHDRLDIEPIVAESALGAQIRPARSTVIDLNRGIAVVPIVGALDHRGESMNPQSGMTSYTAIQATLAQVASTRGVRAIILDIDSPGGSVAGVIETAEFIKKLSAEIPIYAIANSLMASAAFWLGSAATRVYAAPLANIGSVGVVVAHVDQSKAMEKRGVAVTHIHAGARKVDGSPYGPLSDAARAETQARIDAVYAQFIAAVADNRGIDAKVVRGTEAAIFGPEQALELGFIDGIGTLNDVLGALSTRISPSFSGYSATKDQAQMSERLTFAQSDMDSAITRATADAAAAHRVTADAALATALAARTAEIAAAAATLAPENARLGAFFEALTDGASVALAGKMSARIPAAIAPAAASAAADPARARDLATVFAAAAPGVSAEGAPVEDLSPRDARLAQLRSAAKTGTATVYTGGAR